MRKAMTAIVLAAATLGASQALADEANVAAVANGIRVESLGHAITLPRPDFVVIDKDAGDVSDQVEVFRQQVPGGELVEVIAKGQQFESWTEMTSSFVMSKEAMPAEMHVKLLVSAFQQNCAEDKLGFQVVKPTVEGGNNLAVAFCEQFATEGVATALDQGEIMAFTVIESETASARVYVEWRGPAFDAEKPETWPVESIAVLDATLDGLSRFAAIGPADTN